MSTPIFESHASATLDRCKSIFAGRGQEYGDTWRETQFLKMQAVARQLGIDIRPEHFRALATAGFCDMKYWRLLGGYKDDSLVDEINYTAFLAEEMQQLGAVQDVEQDKLSPRGGWFQTYTGRAFYHMDPRPEEINILDIAHGLSLICRFGGQSRIFYSVAQHCILTSSLVQPWAKLQALLHDAPEAYMGDMVHPLKEQMPEFKKVESRIWKAIVEKFSVPTELFLEVKAADLKMLATERRDFMGRPPMPWNIDEVQIEAAPFQIDPMTPSDAERAFLKRFDELDRDRMKETNNESAPAESSARREGKVEAH